MLRFALPAEVWRAKFPAQVTIGYGFTTISLLTVVGRDSRHNYILKQELRRYEPRSRFPSKSPFRPLLRGVLPLSGQQISAEMRKGSPTFWHPGNLVGPQRPLGHCSPASRPTLHARPAGSGHAQTLPRWLLPDTDTRIGKDRTRPDLHERPVIIQRADKELKAPPPLRGSAMVARPTRPQIHAVN